VILLAFRSGDGATVPLDASKIKAVLAELAELGAQREASPHLNPLTLLEWLEEEHPTVILLAFHPGDGATVPLDASKIKAAVPEGAQRAASPKRNPLTLLEWPEEEGLANRLVHPEEWDETGP
jgi:hypothetical protein